MPGKFEQKIHTTLENANLQLALYANTGRLKDNRTASVAESALPDYQELRTHAHALKRHTIDNLDHYLEEFERSVNARGGRVAFCKDGAEACDFILGLAKERGAKLIVKSKS